MDSIRRDWAEAQILIGDVLSVQFFLATQHDTAVRFEKVLCHYTTLTLEMTTSDLKHAHSLREACKFLSDDDSQTQ